MSLVLWGLTPHPPLLLPEVGRDRLEKVEATRRAVRELCAEVARRKPDRLVMVTPHGPLHPSAIGLLAAPRLRGDAARFGAPEVEIQVRTDRELALALAQEAERRKLPLLQLDPGTARRYRLPLRLDHGLLVPLYYLREAGVDVPLVALSASTLPGEIHFRLGRVLREVLVSSGLRTAVIASGDLSHRLLASGPYGFDEMGPRFDGRVLELLKDLDIEGLLGLPGEMVQRAGECGLRPLLTVLGSLEGEVRTRLDSYEGPFGVGYAVARIHPVGPPRPDLRVELARRAVEAFVREGRVLDPPDPLPLAFRERRGAFVCLKREGKLRGCIGTVAPTCPDLAREIIQNAVGACSRDPRFPPVQPAELEDLSVSVDILGEARRVAGPEGLDPRRYGIIVRSRGRSGVLLPDLEGVDTVERQLEIACRKAGISPGEPLDLYRFEVNRYP